MSDWGGPYIVAAFFCRSATSSPGKATTFNGVFFDTTPPAGQTDLTVPLFVMAMPGQARGEVKLGCVIEDPSGIHSPLIEAGGAYVMSEATPLVWRITLGITDVMVGQYWIQIRLSGRMAAKVPLLVRPPIRAEIRPSSPGNG